MKIHKLYLAAIAACLALLIAACSEDQWPNDPEGKSLKNQQGHITADITANVAHYQVTLLDGYPKQVGDNWEWVWKIVNPNPSRYNKDLSHMGISLGDCATMEDVVSAAYSRNGTNWTSFTPSYQEDPSTTGCNSQIGSTLKFDYGTSGTSPTYYKLVVNKNFSVDLSALMLVKFGTTCVVDEYPGLGCENTNTGDCWSDQVTVYGGNRSFLLTTYKYTRYATCTGTTTTYNLTDHDGNVVGSVSITDNSGVVTITYTTTGDWYLTKTFLDVACSNSGLHAYGGYAQLTLFDYQTPQDPYVQSYTYTIDDPMCNYDPDCNCNSIYLMTYAYAVQKVDCDS